MKKEIEKEEKTSVWGIIGIILAVIFFIFFIGAMGYSIGEDNTQKKFGKAICQEQFNQDFDEVVRGVLYCKSKAVNYDGLKVSPQQPITIKTTGGESIQSGGTK